MWMRKRSVTEKTMRFMHGHKKSETALYVVLWVALFAAAAVHVYWDGATSAARHGAADGGAAFNVQELLGAWGLLGRFCLVFFLHDFFIAPLLVYGKRKWLYGILTVLLMSGFVALMSHGRDGGPGHGHSRKEMRMERRGPDDRFRGPKDGGLRHRGPKGVDARPFGGPVTVACTIMLLLLGVNIGTKHYFRSQDYRKRMQALEHDNLNQQLQYLKYQINPHFFMNTLNNIHALVDINPEEAKHTIEVLSKLMRYVLYDADKPMSPLQKELDFLRHYVNLMRIRYTEKVRISVSLPRSVPDVQVPSLLFATFVENAFKHGVSYQRDSFIEVSVRVDETVREVWFLCHNSVKPLAADGNAPGAAAAGGKGGVGLKNAVKRLKLVYGGDYELKTDAGAEEHRLLLRLPFR